MEAVLDPSWSPAASAHRLIGHAVDEEVLRHARTCLRIATDERTTLSQARALATLNIALSWVEAQPGLFGREQRRGERVDA
ncbi:MAG TPA: hypothetical protein VFP34_01520 [Microlunatus sp.]|jgi:hypothetical protein|nr:hypothetical protein [Microlunatus sp.]